MTDVASLPGESPRNLSRTRRRRQPRRDPAGANQGLNERVGCERGESNPHGFPHRVLSSNDRVDRGHEQTTSVLWLLSLRPGLLSRGVRSCLLFRHRCGTGVMPAVAWVSLPASRAGYPPLKQYRPGWWSKGLVTGARAVRWQNVQQSDMSAEKVKIGCQNNSAPPRPARKK